MIGANGAGKSTLLEMVVNQAMGTAHTAALSPDAGVVTWKRDLTLEYVAQEPELDLARMSRSTRSRPAPRRSSCRRSTS